MRRRYAYARVTIRMGEIELVAGVELQPGEGLRVLYQEVRALVERILATAPIAWGDDQIAYLIESHLRLTFGPDRSYFIEVGRGSLDEYVQVYQE